MRICLQHLPILLVVMIGTACMKTLDPEAEMRTSVGQRAAWMATLDDDMPLELLSIPGAHDAASATITTLPRWTQTQALDIPGLWNAGVRAFDLRPALVDGVLGIYHDKYSANVTFPQILSTLFIALNRYPSEFAVVLIRHEEEADGHAAGWGKLMGDCLAAYLDRMVDYHPGLTVGEMRGGILVLSRNRFEGGSYGAYVDGWYSGTELSRQQGALLVDTFGGRHPLWVQDYYDPKEMADKWTAVRALWDAQASLETDALPLVINHCSAYVGKLPDYVKNAAGINGQAASYVRSAAGPLGIVMMDFAGVETHRCTSVYGSELVEALIEHTLVL